MYATILSCETRNGSIYQVAVVARASGQVLLYARTAGGRGRAGAWDSADWIDYSAYPGIDGAYLLGGPSAVKVTESDEHAIDEGKPTVLWQKLARVATDETVPTGKPVREVLLQVIAEAKSNPRTLAQYLGGSGIVAQPNVVYTGAQPGVAVPVTPELQQVIDRVDTHNREVSGQWLQMQKFAEDFVAAHGREPSMEELAAGVIGGVQPVTPAPTPSTAGHPDTYLDPNAPIKLPGGVTLPAWRGDLDAELDAALEEDEQPVIGTVPEALPQALAEAWDAPVEETIQPSEAVNTYAGIHVGASSHIPTPTELSPLTIPDPAEIAHYQERKLAGGKTESEVFDFARSHQRAVAIGGHAGTGKTSSARHYAGKRALPFVVFECNPQVDEEVVQGTFIPTGHGTELAWRYSQLATAIQRPSVILINESNRMSAKANALFLHILQERELIVSRHKNEVLEVHPDCLIITDYNPGYAGTTKHDQAFLDRFAVVLEYKYDREVEKHFIPSPSLLDMADALRKQAEAEDRYRDTPVSTRLLVNFVEQAKALGMEFATASFVASFSAEERDALDMVIAVHSDSIATELGIGEAAVDLDEDEPLVEAAPRPDLFGARNPF